MVLLLSKRSRFAGTTAAGDQRRRTISWTAGENYPVPFLVVPARAADLFKAYIEQTLCVTKNVGLLRRHPIEARNKHALRRVSAT